MIHHDEWLHISEDLPEATDLVALYRSNYPKFQWVGTYEDYTINDETDKWDFWFLINLPDHPTHL